MKGFAIALTVFVVLAGCSGPRSMQSVDTGDVPDWFTSVPNDPQMLYAANTATSQDLQLALDKARTGGIAEIGRQVEVRIQALQKRFDEEVGIGRDPQLLQQFTQVSQTVVSTSVTGIRVKSQETMKDGNMWRAYVLMEYPVGEVQQRLMDQIKKNEQLLTRARSAEAFRELDAEVKKYEESKKAQQ
jgi:hypothetical protein